MNGDCASFSCTVLDALPEQIAVLDGDGFIVAVNDAWRQCGMEHVRAGTGVGANYLEVCRRADGAGAEHAAQAAAGITAVLTGSRKQFQMEYPCHTSSRKRWFSMTVSPLAHGRRGVVVVHVEITERHEAESRLRIAATAFESSEGMMVTDSRGMILKVNQAFTRITGYPPEETIGRTPAMLRSGRHDPAFYKAMWQIISRDDSWEGEIWNRRKNGEIYPEHLSIAAVRDEQGEITHYVGALTDITLSKAANDEIRNLAFYDPLTRLPNRRMLLERLRQVLAASNLHDNYGALVFIDLDNFKTLNDTLGHNVGDLLLQQVGARLQACIRQGDTVARLGGDEFVVLLERMSNDPLEAAAQTETLGAKILEELNRPYLLGVHPCHSTPSLGATLFHQGKPSHPDELLMQADIAMYQAKQAGRNGMRFFDQQMQDAINAHVRMEEALRKAVELRQFELYYQVQVDQHGYPSGAEALIRWIQSDGNCISPANFIPLAEESGLILQIGDWLLETACAQLRRWQSRPATAHLVLAINISAAQLHQSDFCERVQQQIRNFGIDPGKLKLELTEGILLKNIEETISKMQLLKQFGLKFSLDDFGTGYSSLQYLKRLPLSQLKIDQSFVRDLVSNNNGQAIVSTIIAMAHSLQLDVIAEGVETHEQRSLLGKLGCHRYQGYLYGKPLPASQFQQILELCDA
ncbi:PAS domain S-box-containing protein/diguanylate cyclase (GGDEF) domain-containing protein [Duganella sp. CF402]|uniref:putative bifunctional diguanylate cyclase/phosphodiesterase n=1 Tax=unclassified Duganella TaxID=2636909 RepID=UPI0008D7373B|nr:MULTISPECIES: bifunctional diguanylate cyclase/phosphodiesterase [unclassified Duganella]RZT11104.1 PAS domain S-box-containing protein/diguanylate cyclase (GGDEF)-like protein [Duganella sp. BK701]SEK81302.1 PAS domain S-box-containing protein/diguanylate cyclase (GGDEF) domain-containing protein [Duganella sp. CF402]